MSGLPVNFSWAGRRCFPVPRCPQARQVEDDPSSLVHRWARFILGGAVHGPPCQAVGDMCRTVAQSWVHLVGLASFVGGCGADLRPPAGGGGLSARRPQAHGLRPGPRKPAKPSPVRVMIPARGRAPRSHRTAHRGQSPALFGAEPGTPWIHADCGVTQIVLDPECSREPRHFPARPIRPAK